MSAESLRSRIVRAVRAHGVAAVARALDVQRATLTSYLALAARRGTIALIEQRIGRLAGLAKVPA